MTFRPTRRQKLDRANDNASRESRRRRLAMQTLETRRVLAAFTVTTAGDVVDDTDSVVSLREAIVSANSTTEADVVRFDETVFASAGEIDLVLGELSITEPIEILGPGRDLLTIDGQNASRIFNITAASGDVTVADLTLTGGRTTDDNVLVEGVLESTHSGGAIRFVTDGILTIRDSVLSQNRTEGVSAFGGSVFANRGVIQIQGSSFTENRTQGRSASGGALFASDATVSIENSQVLNNSTSAAFSDGGGLFSRNGSVSIVESTVSGNRTTGGSAYGGGMYVNGSGATILRSTISGNSTGGVGTVGGGIAMHGDIDLINSTVSGNTSGSASGSGGGIATIQGELHVVHSTITRNSAPLGVGGGIAVMNNPETRLFLKNSIVAQNNDGGTAPDFLPPPDAGRFLVRGSLIGDNTGTTLAESPTPNSFGNIVGAPDPRGGLILPLLGTLGDNGGPTPTHLPLTGSPAIDNGTNALAVDPQDNPIVDDGRGLPFIRTHGGTVDMGAVEVQPAPSVPVTWLPPAPIVVGSELTATQLNATAPVPGSFVYDPPVGTILDAGEDQVLTVQFTPTDTVNYSTGGATVTIDVVQPLEYGDAPDSYGTLRDNNGARHQNGTLRLGASVDLEADGQPSAAADEDTGDDGVRLIAPVIAHAQFATTTSFQVNVSAVSKLDAWIDFDGNGSFDHPTEHIGGGTSIDLAIRDNLVSVNVPAGSVTGDTFARFRVSTDGGLSPDGLASDGEVEDYAITILNGLSLQDVAIELPSGATTIAADGNDLTISNGTTELFRAPESSVNRFDITGASTSDVLTIDYSGGDPIPVNGLSYDGGDFVNTVRVAGEGSTLDVSEGSNVALTNIDVVDLGDTDVATFLVDSAAMEAIDPDDGGLVVTGGDGDDIVIGDPETWRMGTPTVVAGFFFGRIESATRFIQTELPIEWHNFVRANDVNNDLAVTAGDAIRVINELSVRRFSDRDTSELNNAAGFDPFPESYIDTNGDGSVTPLDALRVINQLARQQGSGEGEFQRSLELRRGFELASPANRTTEAPAETFAQEDGLASFGLVERSSAIRLEIDLSTEIEPSTGNGSRETVKLVDEVLSDSEFLSSFAD